MAKIRQEVKPAKDAQCWYPLKDRPLKKEGEKVVWGSFWERRLRDKSIVLGEGPITDKLKAKAAKVAEMKADAEKKAAETPETPETPETTPATDTKKKGGKK